MHVQLLRITRCFGGREEGGWWYDHTEILAHYIGPRRIAKKYAKAWHAIAMDNNHPHRDRFSMAGGSDWEVRLSKVPADETKHRPRYE